MKTAEIANRYLDYFRSKDHTIVPSASLVSDDPSIMFTIAGMVPFIPYLTGVVPAPYKSVADLQKCIRTNDIEEVGQTARHGTFFQMMGNWSFGDYFKKEAIGYAWELLTSSESDGGLGFAEKDLWVTVYEDDDEAEQLWRSIAGLPANRIQRLGREDNYWTTGQPGPAGPSSEIYVDRGPAYGKDGGPAVDDNRFLEIWNLVFMQYAIDNVRSKTEFDIVGELPQKNIDTGLGLERVAFLKQGVENMYETDQVRPVLDRAVELSGRRYGVDHADDVRFRVIADHVRSSLMLLSDGVTPSNEGRGYILRRLMRRTVRSMRLLGVEEATFPELFAASREAMSTGYPEIDTDWQRISNYAFAEEETFLRTLASGSTILDTAVTKAKEAGTAKLGGDQAFLLHDTYGFPIDLTLEIAEEAGIGVDRDGFDDLMRSQRERAKENARSRKTQIADLSVYREYRAAGETRFLGYDELVAESRVLGLIVDGAPVERASAGQTAEVILPETTLYAESGGQVADRGTIVGAGFELDVIDVQRPVAGLVSHTVTVHSGEVAVGDAATTVVDENNRRRAQAAHSATHLVHAALRDTLGSAATQTGSLNRAGYLRIDFSWGQSLSNATKTEIEEIANSAVSDNLEVTTRVMSLDDAKAAGATALFGEKYGAEVRMVDIGGPWSRELCGGIHVDSSSKIGLISITGESSVSATARRVEAFVGPSAFRQLAAERALVSELTENLNTPRHLLVPRIQELTEELKRAQKRVQEFEAAKLTQRVPEIASAAERVGDVSVASFDAGGAGSVDDLRSLVAQVRNALGETAAVVAIAAAIGDKPMVVVGTNQAARDIGVQAGPLAKGAAGVLGGGGGGKPDMAQGGGSDPSKVKDALASVVASVREARA
ncbi:MAG: alanine--tRNA ligase [Microbacterium gubbeenense]